MPPLREQLDARQPLYQLARALPWATPLREAFADCYSEEGRPAKPVRLMVGLLLLKQLHNLGDETVVAQWVQNPYWQFFCGCEDFPWEPRPATSRPISPPPPRPCDPSDLVYLLAAAAAPLRAVLRTGFLAPLDSGSASARTAWR